MTSLRWLIACSVFAILSASGLQRKETDWEELIIRQNNRLALAFGSPNKDKGARDTYTEDFVYMSPNSTILGDYQALSEEFAKIAKFGYFQLGFPNIIFTCGDTALKWDNLALTDDRNLNQEGFETVLFRKIGDEAKVKLFHYKV